MGFTGVISPYYLVGGFKYCLFSPRMFGEMIQFDGCIFFRWVVQPSPRNSLAFVACPVLLFFVFRFAPEVQRAEYIFFFGGVKFHMRFFFQNVWFLPTIRMVGFMPIIRGLVGLTNFLIPTASISWGGNGIQTMGWTVATGGLWFPRRFGWHLWNVTKFWQHVIIHSLTNG